jgi:L-tyrosine peroxygenase
VTADAAVVKKHAPATDWSFGAYRYGLEPLVLPQPDKMADVRPLNLEGQRAPIADELQLLSEFTVGPPRPRLVAAPEYYDDVFWFRWITGHQTTFALWHLTGRVLRQISSSRIADAEILVTLTNAYSAMLLYSGSCTSDVYNRLIRPMMYHFHHGFSGSWAPDYTSVRSLFYKRESRLLPADRAAELQNAIQVNRDVHAAVAARLVQGSQSLLHNSIGSTRLQDRRTLGVMYDQFFLTLRSNVSDEEIVSQFLRRLRTVLLDISDNGLFPRGQTSHSISVEYSVPFIRECEDRFPETAAGIALFLHDLA